MIRNYLKTGTRNLRRNKAYALINVLGLAVGIAACLLIFLVIQYETSFDKFHSKRKEIYRIGTEIPSMDGVTYSAGIAFPAGPVIKTEFPQIKEEARIFRTEEQLTVDDNHQLKKFNEPNIFLAEPAFFKIFDFPWLSGDPQKVLLRPDAVALTQEIAEKYFGDWHKAMGKTIKIKNKNLYTVQGILKNIPDNSDFPLDIVLSYESLKGYGYEGNLNDWVSTFGNASCFVTIPANYPLSKFNSQLAPFAKKHRPAEYDKDKYIAQPLAAIHYDHRLGNYRQRTFSPWLINVLVMIGVFLVIIAYANFINLATAQAVNRSKEVGVRKVLGGNRKQLAFQFLSETALITIVSVIVALGIATAALPFLNDLLKVKMSINIFSNPLLIFFLLATVIVVTLLSGLYPALILSGFNPIIALKNKLANKTVGGISLRRALVVLQFGIAQMLIIGTLIVLSQMNFFRKATMGFTKASILNVDLPTDSLSLTKFEFFKNKLIQNPNITNVSFSIAPPAARGNWNTNFKYDHSTKNTDFDAILKWADVDYFKTYDLQFIAGRPYYPGDTVREIVVNETLLRKLGVKEPGDAIGKEVSLWDGEKIATISGVVRVFRSKHRYFLQQSAVP